MSLFIRRENLKTFVRRFPSTTLLSLAIITIQIATYYFGNGPTDLETARRFGAIQTGDTSPDEWIRLATYIFVQIGGTSHIIANVACLLIFGPPLEKIYGSAKFTLLFFVTGMSGGLFILVFSTNVIAAGASGSIFGLMGLYLGLIIKRTNMIDSESKSVIWSTFVINIIYTFLAPNISISAHLGGLVSGLILSFFVRQQSFRQLAGTKWSQSVVQIIIVTFLLFFVLSFTKYLPASANFNELVSNLENVKSVVMGKLSSFNINSNKDDSFQVKEVQNVQVSQLYNEDSPLDGAENGFEYYENDGFSMQVPLDWEDLYIDYSYSIEDQFNTKIDFEKKPISKHYEYKFLYDIDYTMDINIYPYDKNIDPYTFLSQNELSDDFKEVDVMNADKAFAFIDYKDDIIEQSSRSLIVFKNNVYYKIYASHNKGNSQGTWIEYDRENIKKFRKDIEVMFSSFHIIDDGITIQKILEP